MSAPTPKGEFVQPSPGLPEIKSHIPRIAPLLGDPEESG